MKKFLFVAIGMIASGVAFSQGNINKGNIMVGGSLGFDSEKTADDPGSQVTYFNISPNVGYFFINNLAGGLRLSFENRKPEGGTSYSSFSAAPFVRYYFLPSTQKVNVFADASYGFGSEGGSNKVGFNFFGINAGAAIFLVPSVALEAGIGYTSFGGEKHTLLGKVYRENHFGLKVGFQIHLGGK